MEAPPLPHLGHQLAVLGVHPGDGADVLAVLHHLEELAVSQHEHVLIGHEHLKGIHPFFPHQRLHLGLHLQGRRRRLNRGSAAHHLHRSLTEVSYRETQVAAVIPLVPTK